MFYTINSAQEIDSLVSVAENSKYDSTRVRIYSEISEYCDVPDIPLYSNLAIKYASIIDKKGESNEFIDYNRAQSYNNLGFYYHFLADYQKAVSNYNTSLQLFLKIPDSSGIALVMNNLAMVYDDKGETSKTLELLDKALEISLKVNDNHLVNTTYTNLSKIYNQLGNYEKAIYFGLLGLAIQEDMGDVYGMGFSLNNLATLHFMQKDYKNAEKYMLESLALRLEYGDVKEIGTAYSNLGVMYLDMGKDSLGINYLYKAKKAREEARESEKIAEIYVQIGVYYYDHNVLDSTEMYLTKALKLSETINSPQLNSSVAQRLALMYNDQKEFEKAIFYGKQSMNLSQQLGFPENIRNSALSLSEVYASTKDYKNAYKMHKLYLKMRDSLDNDKNQHHLIQQEVNAKYEKKRFADSIAHASEKQISLFELEAANAELEKTNTQNFALGIGIFMLLVLVSISLIAYRNKRNAANEISIQKVAIEQQKEQVEEAHKEITDSINYAERIQRSFLATDDLLSTNLKDYFVFFQPKDVVSGDFYWAGKLSNSTFAMVNADSTGHGVPGAIMSILNVSSIEKAIDKALTSPADIFNDTRKTIIERLNKDGSEHGGKDGMDASIVCFDFKTLKMTYCAAQNPIWVIRNEGVIQIKPEKMPVGKHHHDNRPFLGGEIQLQKGDQVYTLTDGFQDQFGGEKSKKFMIKKLREYILSIAHLSMKEQNIELGKTFTAWKGDNEQVDDVCVIGVKI